MFIGTGGSRIIRRNTTEARRKTLLEISKAKEDDQEKRTRSKSDCTSPDAVSSVRPKYIQMKKMDVKSDFPAKERPDNVFKEKEWNIEKKGTDFKTTWTNIVSKNDVTLVTSTQQQTLRKFEETNEMLHQFNNLSEITFTELQKCYKSHVSLLTSLKDDLDHIFSRVRSLKEKLKDKYPESFEATRKAIEELKERQKMEIELKPIQGAEAFSETKLPNYSEIGHAQVDIVPEYSEVCSSGEDFSTDLEKSTGLLSVESVEQNHENMVSDNFENRAESLVLWVDRESCCNDSAEIEKINMNEEQNSNEVEQLTSAGSNSHIDNSTNESNISSLDDAGSNYHKNTPTNTFEGSNDVSKIVSEQIVNLPE